MIKKFKPGLLILTVLFCAPLVLEGVSTSPEVWGTAFTKKEKRDRDRHEKQAARERKKLEAKKKKEDARKAGEERRAKRKKDIELKKKERQEKAKLRKEKSKSKKERTSCMPKKERVKKEKPAKKEKAKKVRHEKTKVKKTKPTKKEIAKSKKEKLAIMAQKRKEEKTGRAERKQVRAYTMAAQDRAAVSCRKAAKEKMLQTKLQNEAKREKLMADWKVVRGIEVSEDYKDGQYADLYKIPAWPFHMMYADYKKDLFQANLHYDYAVDSFSSKGSSQNLSNLEFGESTFKFSDILLSLKLNEKGILAQKEKLSMIWNNLLGKSQPTNIAQDSNRRDLLSFDNNLVFNAKSQEYGLSLDYLRYLKGKDICIGFQLPIGYKSHKLKLSSPFGFGTAKFVELDGYTDDNITYDISNDTWIDIPSQVYLQEYLNFVLAAKPSTLAYYPKSSITGIGDLSTFITMQVQSRYFEKFLLGFKVLWPTAKEADTKKLWAPTLGNGGFTEFVLYTSMLFNHQKSYFNPHFMLQLDVKAPGHIDKRVPKILSGTRGANNNVTSDSQRLADMMALGDHVQFITPDANGYSPSFSNYPDSTVAAFADNVRSVKMTPGAEFNFRLGNIFEKLIFRRAFLDIFYDFRARLKDYIAGSALPRDQWNVDQLKDRTNQIAHKIGFLYDYQFDYQTRLRLGVDYVFAGINVPSTVSGNLSIAAEF